MEWIKSHPYLTAALTIGAIILFFVFRGRSSGGTQVIQTGPSDAAIASGNALQAAQIQAQAGLAAQNAALQAAIAGKQIESNTQVQLAGAARDIQSIQGAYGNEAVQAQLLASQTNAATQAQIAQAGFNRDISVTGIRAGVAESALQNQLAQQKEIDTASLAALNVQSNAYTDAATLQADVQKQQIAAGLAATQDTNATAVNVAGIQAGRDVNIAQIGSTTATTIAATNAQTQQQQIAAAENVYTDYINESTGQQAFATQVQQQTNDQIIQLLALGKINSADTAAVATSLSPYGAPVGTAIEQAHSNIDTAPGNTPGGIATGVLQSGTNLFRTVFGTLFG